MTHQTVITDVAEKPRVHGYYDVVGESEYGRKLSPGDTITIEGVNLATAQYGTIAVFDTPEGRRYSGAQAIVDFAEKLLVKPELLPVRVGVGEAISAVGRRYITFIPV